jgi:hypothetical protein
MKNPSQWWLLFAFKSIVTSLCNESSAISAAKIDTVAIVTRSTAANRGYCGGGVLEFFVQSSSDPAFEILSSARPVSVAVRVTHSADSLSPLPRAPSGASRGMPRRERRPMISTLPTGESSEHRRQDQASSKHSSAQPHQAGAPKHQAHDADKTGEIGGHLHGVHCIAPLSRSGPQTDISAMGMIILTGLCQALSRPGPALHRRRPVVGGDMLRVQ